MLRVRDWRRFGVATAVTTAVVVFAAMTPAQAIPAPTYSVNNHPPKPSAGPAVTGVTGVPSHFAKAKDQAARNYVAPAPEWPAATTRRVSLPATNTERSTRAKVGDSPAWVARSDSAAADAVEVRVLDHAAATAAGVDGALLTVTGDGAGGSVRVGLDYAGFAGAYGGDFGDRLRLVRMPACALSTPSVADCRRWTPLPSANDPATRSVSATVPLSAAASVVAAVSDPGTEGSGAGSYAATTLSPSGTWAQSGSSGSFTYSYPVSVPPASSALLPQVALSYDSGSVDGQTATTQAQSSWVGDGWSTPQSYIEQTFTSCADQPEGSDAPAATGDECYAGPVLTMSLDGTSNQLIWDKTKKVWKPSADSGMVITHKTGSNAGQGTYNTDWWQVTERDGTVYSFGMNHLPGWPASGGTATNSVDYEPVYSAHASDNATQEPTDPCYSSSGFTASVCTMAYRWNLDYVKDVHGNALAYYYQQDTNRYGQHNGDTQATYIRDSHLDHIDYGFTDGNAYGTVPDKVLFHTTDRCVSSGCGPLSATTKASWPDVPFDLVCTSGTCTSYSPSFFSTQRLTSIVTEQYSTTAAGYVPVDTYGLSQSLPSIGDNKTVTLWLDSISHTGSDTTACGNTCSAITLPTVSFGKISWQNRVDSTTDGLTAFNRYRIWTITTETGSVISVTYTLQNPCTAPVTLNPASNTASCYPVYWTPQGYAAPFLDWFNKYVVKTVTQTDPTGGAPQLVSSYNYPGGAAWHYDDNEVVKKKYRTYGQFRGYGTVQSFTGDGSTNPRTENDTTYYRGMSKDNNTTVVNLTDALGGSHEDVNQLAGQALETTARLGEGGPVDHSTISSYWVSGATATRTRDGLPDLTATTTAEAESLTRQAVTTGGTTTWQYLETDTSYDATITDATFGLPLRQYRHTSPTNAAYDTCTSTTYTAANTTANIVGKVAETETVSVACGGYTAGSPASVPHGLNTLTAPASVSRPAQVVSDTRTFYDDPTFATTFPQTTAPAKGDVTMVAKAADYTSGAYTWQTTSRSAYDSYGRVTDVYDARGKKTTTTYTVNTVGLTTTSTVTNPLNQSVVTSYDTARGLTTVVKDANNLATTSWYDALGRVISVWLGNASTSLAANYKYTYTVQNNGPSGTVTLALNSAGGYRDSVSILDGLLRSRQTQDETAQGGRLIADTTYDSRGWKATTDNWWNSDQYPALGAPADPATSTTDTNHVPVQDTFTYDGLGRVVVDTSSNNNTVVSTTTTVYNGDRTTVIPPAGATTQTTVSDPLGRTTELDQYTTAPTLHAAPNPFTGVSYVDGGTVQKTLYGYDGHGNQSTVTSPGNTTWTSTYNLLGQITQKQDPDAGTSTLQYDADGNLTQSTDARQKTISYLYDDLNRKTAQYDAPLIGQADANLMATWVYDNANAVSGVTAPIGHLTTETTYIGGKTGAAYTIQQKAFNGYGEPYGQIYTIPAAEGALAKSYTITHGYTAQNGLLSADSYNADGGLPSEKVNHNYHTIVDAPDGVAGVGGYGGSTTYDAWGRPTQEPVDANQAAVTNTWDPHTGRLTNQLITRATGTPVNVDQQHYTYDQAGNILTQVSTRSGSTATSETQCFRYDGLDRLTTAWTATDNCAATPTTSSHAMVGDNLSTLSAYWTSWTFTTDGQRNTTAGQTDHATTSTGADTTTNYTYNGNNTGQPHTLTATNTSGATTGATSYSYDPTGNMTTRTTPSDNQTLTWNDTGQLTQISSPTSGTTSYVYDPDGNVLLQKDPNSTILYLPGEQLTLHTATQTVTGIRYYNLPCGAVAVRTGTGTNWSVEFTDQHGTGTLTLDTTAQTPTWRQYTPYGAPRGAAPGTWIDNRGFLDKPLNTTTGLTQLGARQYDPTTGQFISLDPVFEATDPQQLNGYSYAGSNPATGQDPNGLFNDWQGYGAAGEHAMDGTNDNIYNAVTDYLKHHKPPKKTPKDKTPARTSVPCTAYETLRIGCTMGEDVPVPPSCSGTPDYDVLLQCIKNPEIGIGSPYEALVTVTVLFSLGLDVAAFFVAPTGEPVLISAEGTVIAGEEAAAEEAEAEAASEAAAENTAGTADTQAIQREVELAAMLRDAARQKGFSGIGSGTRAEADIMGEAWVGPNYKVATDGKTLISQDGLRQYRPPSFKPNRPIRFGGPGYQANFEWRVVPKGQWQADAHLDITD